MNSNDLYLTFLKQGKNRIFYDRYGRLVNLDHTGRDYDDGYEIDHKWPSSKGGKDAFKNLEIVNWKSNAEKSDKVGWVEINNSLYYISEVEDGIGNIQKL